jgi:DNA-binding beta-propeller fold protein YncE
MKRNIFVLLTVLNAGAAFLLYSCSNTNKHKLEKKWETEAVFKVPESVLFDKANNILYVSNIEGKDTWAADGKGSVSKMGADGKNIVVDWVAGLNAPKGMGLYKGKLYVADPTDIVVIDIDSAKIEKRIHVAGAVGLNDITVDKEGIVYVSDSEGKKIYRMENDSVELFFDKLSQPNGVLMYADNFYLLDSGSMYKMNTDKSLNKLAEGMEGGTDGVEAFTGKDFIVSTWDGVVYYVYADGKKEKLLDGRSKEIKSADIAVDTAARTVFVPTFWKNTVVAYEVK